MQKLIFYIYIFVFFTLRNEAIFCNSFAFWITFIVLLRVKKKENENFFMWLWMMLHNFLKLCFFLRSGKQWNFFSSPRRCRQQQHRLLAAVVLMQYINVCTQKIFIKIHSIKVWSLWDLYEHNFLCIEKGYTFWCCWGESFSCTVLLFVAFFVLYHS